ncbi:hypothetical protein BDQ17DRAFT_1430934 [Cyathus striatus]|nr:hypothetical protein BDQ17DRAFT_1430934 [Cyathus striatus]
MSRSNRGSKSNPSKSKPSSSRRRKRSPSIDMVELNKFDDYKIGSLSPLFKNGDLTCDTPPPSQPTTSLGSSNIINMTDVANGKKRLIRGTGSRLSKALKRKPDPLIDLTIDERPSKVTCLAPDKDKGFDWLESEISDIINRLRELDMKMQEILLEIRSIT